MFTKTQGVVGRGWGWQKIGIELGFDAFYPDSIPTGDVPNFVLCLFNTKGRKICIQNSSEENEVYASNNF